jgi:GGDEF domain-containing protein
MDIKESRQLRQDISPAGAWAFAIGTSIGWGSLVVTSNTYLSQAGIMGSVLGLLLGAAAMLLISRNYAYMMQCYPETGGAYTFAKEQFGYDHGFLTAWFLKTIANRDAMTGVKNKNAFLYSENEINQAIQRHQAGAFAVVVCDVNGLKYINDNFGHKAGDDYIPY